MIRETIQKGELTFLLADYNLLNSSGYVLCNPVSKGKAIAIEALRVPGG